MTTPRDICHGMTAVRLRGLMTYDPDTGEFIWSVNRSGRYARSGNRVGHVRRDGYLDACVDGRLYMLHRLAWLYVTGSFPNKFLDHKNGDRSDNRFSNLREVTRQQNRMNVKGSMRSGSKYAGVSKRTIAGGVVWRARITSNGVCVNLGHFPSEVLALASRIKAEREMFGEYSPLLHIWSDGL